MSTCFHLYPNAFKSFSVCSATSVQLLADFFSDDIEGCEAILDWLAYVPEHRQGPLPIMVDPTDPVSRPVAYKPARATEDPRLMFTGSPNGRALHFFSL